MVQRGAEAVYSLEGKKQVRGLIDFYMENAKIMKNKLQNSGYKAVSYTHLTLPTTTIV